MQQLNQPPTDFIQLLKATATDAEKAEKINEIIDHINYLLEGHIMQQQ